MSAAPQGQQLLFGVMAIQLGFVTAQQVLACGAEWATRHKESPGLTLAAVLEERGQLSAGQRRMVEDLAAQALELAGGDGDKALDSLSPRTRAVAGSLSHSMVAGPTLPRSTQPQVDSLSEGENVVDEVPGRYAELSNAEGEPIELGRGGIGRVMLVHDAALGRDVAMKELIPEVTSDVTRATAQTMRLEERFLREARVTGQLEHPAIVPVYEVGRRTDGTLYYTMMRIRGRTLDAAVQQTRTLEGRLRLVKHVLQVAQALAHAHARGVVHRDIKPQNVMIGSFGETYLLDWGLARVQGKSDPRASDLKLAPDITGAANEGGAVGTPSYMSPEQAAGRLEEVDARSDVWGLGAVLYEVLTGRPPYEGLNPFDVLSKILRDPVRPVRELEPSVPTELMAICDRCLQRKKAARYQGCDALARDLEAYLTGGTVSAYEYSAWQLLERFVGRNRWAVLASGVAAVALLTVTVVGVLRVNRQREEAGAFARVLLSEVRAAVGDLETSRDLVASIARTTLSWQERRQVFFRRSDDELLEMANNAVTFADALMRAGQGVPAAESFAGAVDMTDTLLRRDPANSQARIVRVDALGGLSDSLRGTAQLERARLELAKADADVEALVAQSSENLQVVRATSNHFYRVAAARLFEGDIRGAIEPFERSAALEARALALSSTSDKGYAKLVGNAGLTLQALGNAHEALGDPARARVAYQRMIELYAQAALVRQTLAPADGPAVMGAFLRRQRDPAATELLLQAEAMYARLIEAVPTDAVATSQLVILNLELGRLPEALRYARAMRDDKLGGDYLDGILWAYVFSGEFNGVLELLAQDPGSSPLLRNLAAAISNAMLGRPQQAAEAARAAANGAGEGSLVWVQDRWQGMVEGKTGPAVEAVRVLCQELDEAQYQYDTARPARALETFARKMSALSPP